jgi:hypothetical protein
LKRVTKKHHKKEGRTPSSKGVITIDKYYILTRRDGKKYWEERKGRKLKNDYELDLYIEHRDKNYWVISEAKTGLKVCEGRTRKATIEILNKLFEQYNAEFFNEQIKKFIKEFGLSPLYSKEVLYPILNKEDE